MQSSALDRVKALPARLDDDTLTKVEAWLTSPLPPMPLADRECVLQFIRLLSDMPRRGDDGATGEVRKENIIEHLSGKPRAQLTWLAREAHVRWTFYPTVKQLLELAAEWERDDTATRARTLARAKVEQERQARLREARQRLKYEGCEQDWIDAMPEHQRQILAAERLLHRCPDCGTYTQRPGWRDYQAFIAAQGQAA
jgi:hypothetical protein